MPAPAVASPCPDHAGFALSLAGRPWPDGYGETLVAEGQYREAASVLEKALRVRERAEPNCRGVGTAETRFALAQAHWALNRDRAGALALATAARDAYRQLPGHKKRADEVDAWLAGK